MNPGSSSSFTPSVLPMTAIRATSVGESARARLAQGAEGSVVGAFDRAVNIALSRGLVCLVTQEAGRGPLNIAVKLPSGVRTISCLGLRIGDRVRIRRSNLELGEHCRIFLGSADTYSPSLKLKLEILGEDRLASNLETMRSTALRRGRKKGLGGLMALVSPRREECPTGRLNIFASAALPSVVRLERAYHSENVSELTEAVRGLIGLGPGLTPSSDDMLAGLVLACALCSEYLGHSRRAARFVAEATVAEARGKTTTLSEEYLRQAAAGRGNEPVMKLCEALLTGSRASVERWTVRLLALGDTSGTDAVLGILLGIKFCTGQRSGLSWGESPW